MVLVCFVESKIFNLNELKSGKAINGIKTQKNNLEAFKKTDVIGSGGNINSIFKHKIINLE